MTVEYNEGAEVGYRWFAQRSAQPLYPFGHGLSYTSFDYADFKVTGGDTISATFTVINTGERDGATTPQLYLNAIAGQPRKRLLGFERVELPRGESRNVSMTADPRLLARFDCDSGQWCIDDGSCTVVLGADANDVMFESIVRLSGRSFGR